MVMDLFYSNKQINNQGNLLSNCSIHYYKQARKTNSKKTQYKLKPWSRAPNPEHQIVKNKKAKCTKYHLAEKKICA